MMGEQWANQEPRYRDWWPMDQWGLRGRGQARRKLESMSPNVYFPASARVVDILFIGLEQHALQWEELNCVYKGECIN